MVKQIFEKILLIGIFGALTDGRIITITRPKHPPVPTATFTSLPSEFDDLPEKSQRCWKSYYDYSFTSNFLVTEFAKSSTRIETVFTPPLSGTSYYNYEHTTNCKTKLFGTSTLCDKVPRATSREVSCQTVPTTGSYVWVQYRSELTVVTPTWTSEFKQPAPTCQVAADLSPLCARFFDAYAHRTKNWKTEKPSSTDRREWFAVPPCIPLVQIPEPDAQPACRMSVGSYSAYHWPRRAPQGSEFCNKNGTTPIGTPTIPGKPNTAVVSGHTLTSPSVYHFLKNVQLETFMGVAWKSAPYGPPPVNIWNVSTVIPPAEVLTVAQLEKDVLTASKKCIGIEGDYCTITFGNNFRVHDIATVRADVYDQYCNTWCSSSNGGILIQKSFTPTLGIHASEIVKQNDDVFGDCEWLKYETNLEGGWISHTSSDVPAVLIKDLASTAFVPITPTARVIMPALTATPASRTQTIIKPTP